MSLVIPSSSNVPNEIKLPKVLGHSSKFSQHLKSHVTNEVKLPNASGNSSKFVQPLKSNLTNEVKLPLECLR